MTLDLPGIDTLPPATLRQRALGQWDTPPWLAAIVAGEAHLPEHDINPIRVLEPSAGLGNIVAACLDRGAHVTAIDLDPLRVAHLRERFAGCPVEIVEGDFLALAHRWDSEDFDCVVGNPPYDDGADTHHLAAIADIMCRGHGQCDASLLLRTVALHGKERGERVWSRVHARVHPCVERVAFGEEAGMVDVSVFAMRRGASRVHVRRAG